MISDVSRVRVHGRERRLGRGVGRHTLLVAVACAFGAFAAGCLPTGFKHIDPSYSGVLITADGRPGTQGDGYALTATSGTTLGEVALSADATVASGNLRSAFYPVGQPPASTGDVCATWLGPTAPDDLPQEGLAVRIETSTAAARRAITITKNIFGPDPSMSVRQLNVNLWTLTPTGDGDSLQNIGMDFSDVVAPGGVLQPFPWRVCARVAGSTIVTDVATGATPPAPFTDAAAQRTVALPPGWDYPGQFGWYIGHLHGGMSFDYGDLSATTPLPPSALASGG